MDNLEFKDASAFFEHFNAAINSFKLAIESLDDQKTSESIGSLLDITLNGVEVYLVNSGYVFKDREETC